MIKNILFVGIGGIGMSSIAQYLLKKKYNVSGYDKRYSAIINNLESLGLIYVDDDKMQDTKFLSEIDLVVRTSAIKLNAAILSKSRELGIPIIKRSEILGQICSFGHQICLAGTHGKTTTTAMTSLIFSKANLVPTTFVGGIVKDFGDNFLLGKDKIFIVEADEYDRSFLDLNPLIAGISNIEEDHLDIYKDLEDIKKTFKEFTSKIPFYGTLILPYDLPFLDEFRTGLLCNIQTFGFDINADWCAYNLKNDGYKVSFDLMFKQKFYTNIKLNSFGIHNIKNALISIAISDNYQIDKKYIKEGLEKFSGVNRRMDKLGIKNKVLFVDDYAHHPSEIKATLSALKESFSNRIIAVFQPHLYSRTRDFFSDFAKYLSIADKVILTEIYPAREKPIKNITSKLIGDSISKSVYYVGNKEEMFSKLNQTIKKDDIVISLGAGTISLWIHEYYEKY